MISGLSKDMRYSRGILLKSSSHSKATCCPHSLFSSFSSGSEAGLNRKLWLTALGSEEWRGRLFHSQTRSDLPNVNPLPQLQILTGQGCLALSPLLSASSPSPRACITHYSCFKTCSLSRTDLSFWLSSNILHPFKMSIFKVQKNIQLCQCDYRHLPFIDNYVDGFQSTYMHSTVFMKQARRASPLFYRCSKPDSGKWGW